MASARYYPIDKECRRNIRINDNLYLEKELNNKYDKFAIKVLYSKNNTYHIGYIPILEMLRNNIKCSAKVQYINFNSESPDDGVTASVKLDNLFIFFPW